MASHIESVASSPINKVTKSELYAACKGGDLVFCSGRNAIDAAIEKETSSPFSHVLMIWIPPWSTEWLTLESTLEKGVHVGRFGDYVDNYDGDLVLARRPALTLVQLYIELNMGFALLDDCYDWIEEVSMATRKLKLFSKLPVIKPEKQLYCSGLMQAIAINTIPFGAHSVDWLTPEQIYADSSVEAVCALLRA